MNSAGSGGQPDSTDTPAAHDTAAAPGWLRHAVAFVFCLAAFAACLYLFTRHIDFPLGYHPDEPRKAQHIVENRREYRHPLLLMEAAQAVYRLGDFQKNSEGAVLAGRWASAGMAAAAVAALGLAAYRVAGLVAMALAILAAGLCPSLVVYAHYMKEDAPLVFGIALTILATAVFWTARSSWGRWLAVAFVGAACGVAVSAKYSGIYAVAAALPLVAIRRPLRWHTPALRVLILAEYFAATALCINYRVADNPARFREDFDWERKHGVTEHRGVTMRQPNAYFVRALVREAQPHAMVLGAAAVAWALVRLRRQGLWDLYVWLFAAGYLAMTSWCVIPFHRYVLPVLVLAYFATALEAARAGAAIASRWRIGWLLPAAVGGVVVAAQLPRCLAFLEQFRDDSRLRLREWMARNLPRGASVLAERDAQLRAAGIGRRDAQALSAIALNDRQKFAPDAGSLAAVARRYRYVVVLDFTYARYFDPCVIPVADRKATDEYESRKRWYDELFTKHELVWSSSPRPPTWSYTNPELRLYRLVR